MERRIVLVGLAALVGTPAFAQSAPATDAPAAPEPLPTAPEPGPAPAMRLGQPVDLSDTVLAHRKATMAVGSLSLALSRIALGKVRGPMLKQFTQFEIAEQETIADILKSAMMPDAKPLGEVKAPSDAELMVNLDAKAKALVETMQAMKAGEAFDHDFVKAQIEGHRMLRDIQISYLKNADARDETILAKLAKGMIEEHLALLGDIEKHLG